MSHSVAQPRLRDPDARRRAGWALLALLALWPLVQIAEFRPVDLFDARNLAVMGGFLGQFFPPNLSGEFLVFVLKATIETLAMATAGTALAMLLALPLGLVLTHSLSVSRIGPGPDRSVGEAIRALARMVLLILRGIPELVWALLLVRAFGLGPAAGVLAIGLTYGGMLGKVYSEIMESGDTRPARVLLETGSGRLMAFFYGLLPGAAQELASYTIYRWECAVRASVIMGFVGAGGLGQLMDQSMKMLNGGEVSTILIVFLLLVLLADALSVFLRKLLA
ncbi:MAG: ABC transporter permease subunit [Burkholderiales bacterium]|nr:ABC transporter permease subunit [Burkholderiales bacterium]